MCSCHGARNLVLGCLTSLSATACEDDFGCVEASEMAGRFEPNPDVRPRDNDSLSREVLSWVWKWPELIVKESHDEIAGLGQSINFELSADVLRTRVYSQIESHNQRQDPCKWIWLWFCNGIHGDENW